MICLPPKVNFRTLIALTLVLVPLTMRADKEFDTLKVKAEKRDASAQFNFGAMYYRAKEW